MGEVVDNAPNAVRFVSWPEFRDATKPWSVSHPNVPTHLIYYCMLAKCDYDTGSNYKTGISARMALAQRARQIYAIGADYTINFSYSAAEPAYPNQPANRGLYRCDTFVVDVFQATQGWNMNHAVPPDWQGRMVDLKNMVKTPTSVWRALNN